MNRQETIIVALLFLTLLVWMFVQHQQAAVDQRMRREAWQHQQRVMAERSSRHTGSTPSEKPTEGLRARVSDSDTSPSSAHDPIPAHPRPEKRLTLSNREVTLVVSSRGGGIVEVVLPQYRERIEEGSGPMRFDFSSRNALAVEGIPGLSSHDDLTLTGGGTTGVVTGVLGEGLTWVRSLRLETPYRLVVEDAFVNGGDTPVRVPAHYVTLGLMQASATAIPSDAGLYLEIDVHPARAEHRAATYGTQYFSECFGVRSSFFGCARPNVTGLPVQVGPLRHDLAVDWLAVKNRFFVQLLYATGGSMAYRLYAVRHPQAPGFALQAIGADLAFEPLELPPGGETRRMMSYYIGPKKYDWLKQLGHHQDGIMLKAWPGFGWYRGLCAAVLWSLNRLYDVFRNYGVAIIVVTILVRLIFWPVTHLSTQSMKRMQALQPQIKALQRQYADSPQKMHQEIMALYKAHKVNPMAGCLPMLVQLPVFVALFNVLRNAVELRFAPFLWIADLSEPEGLLSGKIPLVGEFNILPLLMTATAFLQNRLTPTSADPQQKAMSTLMPVMMLVFFYRMASGLVLYWTVSQILAILQLLWQRRRRSEGASG